MTDATQPQAWREAGVHAILKATSARWFCTIAAMWVWAYLAWAGSLSAEFHATIITLIVKSYFDRKGD